MKEFNVTGLCIFESLLYDYLIAQKEMQKLASRFTQIDKSGTVKHIE